MIDVVGVERLGGHKPTIEFSDGTAGTRDFSFLLERTGPMVEPLKDPAYFPPVFIDDGALAWPNGYDWDPISLRDEMKEAGLLQRAAATE